MAEIKNSGEDNTDSTRPARSRKLPAVIPEKLRAARQGFQVLLLDDNPDDRLLILRQLKHILPDLEVTEVTHGEQFESVLKSNQFNLIITDYQLRWTDGLEVLTAVKERWPDCPTIMFTGTGTEEVAVAAMKLGADDYVLKSPRHYDLLPTVIQTTLDKARQRQALKEAEERILRLNQTMISLLSSFPDVVFVIDADHQVTLSNEQAQRFSHSLNLEGQLPEEIEKLVEHVLTTGENHLPRGVHDVHRFNIDNEERYFLPRVMAMRTPEQAIFGAALVLQDVTEFRLLDEVKSNLISTVSHELKTPLTSVRTSLYLLLEKVLGPLTPRQTEMLSMARDDADRLLRMLNALLDLTRFEDSVSGIDLDKVHPEDIIKGAIEEVKSLSRSKRLTVQTNFEPELPKIEVDPQRIGHVIANLLSNACKHSPNGGAILIKATRHEEDSVRICVCDEGPGIASEYHNRIFDKFFRVPGESRKGTGLGLAIAKEFVKAHRGHIGVYSTLGTGSEFYVILPIISPHRPSEHYSG